MAYFIFYPSGVIIADDFFEIKPVIDFMGDPTALRCKLNNVDCTVDFLTGRFYVNGLCICPADGDVLLTDKKVEYRPIWWQGMRAPFRRWYRTFQIGAGEIGARWIIFLGWQFTEKGRNFKRMLQIHQDGTIGIG